MKKLLTILFLLASVAGFAQSESSAQRTVDTLIVENSGNGPCNGGVFATTWRVRFTLALDGTTRPTIAYINGAGEVGTDTTNISKYGPYYWKNNGWDGSVHLANGVHYPNIIGIEQPAVNQRPWHLKALFDILFSIYPQLYLAGSFHMMGLSEGSSCIQDLIAYQSSPGVFPGAAVVTSMVDLEGQGGETDFGCTVNPTYPAFMGYWAKNFGGKFLGLEGVADSRNIWQITQNIGDSTGQNAYFSYTNFNCGDGSGTGGHGCWNSMYNPAVTNWTNVGAPGNANVVISTSPASTAGNYVYSATTGTNLFQWALRQGDTSLKGVTTNPIVTVGSNQSIQLPTSSATTTGTATGQGGHTISSQAWTQTSGPNTATITAPTSLTTSFTGLIAGSYVEKLTATDNTALTGSASITITVLAEVPPTVTPGGPYSVTLPTSSQVIAVTASGNGGATISTYAWTKTSGPGSTTITGNTTASPTVSGLTTGTYVFHCVVTDSNGNTTGADVTVVVSASAPTPDTFPHAVNTRRIGEYMTGGIDSAGHAFLSTNNPSLNGANGSSGGPRGTRVYCIMPSGMLFRDAAPTLHGMLWLSTIGQIVATGLNDQGQNMVPGFGTQATGTQVLVDSSGIPLTNIYIIKGFYAANVAQGSYAVKHGAVSDTVYASGYLGFGMPGDGILHPDSTSIPVKVWAPAGKRVVQIQASKYSIARLNDGTVWTTGGSNNFGSAPNYAYLGYAGSGNQYLSWHQVTIPGSDSIVWVSGGDVCGTVAIGKSGNWYAWGPNSKYLGDATGAGYSTPTNVNSTLRAAIGTLKDSQLVSNSASFACINSTGKLFTWGLNNMGTCGNGQMANIDSALYFMDPSATTGLFVITPQQITNASDWVEVQADNKFGYLTWAKRLNGIGHYWGRDKVGLTERGVDECDTIAGNQGAQYPDSWNLKTPTPTNIVLAANTILVPSPYCNANPAALYCSLCTRPATTPAANAGGNQTISVSSTTLSGFNSISTGGVIVSHLWSFTSGPTTPLIDIVASPLPAVTGMTTPGAYVFSDMVTDNAGRTSSAPVTVTVGTVTPTNKLSFPFRVIIKSH